MAKTKKAERGEGEINLGLGGVFRGLGNLIDLLSEMAEEGKTEVSRTGELKGKELKGVYGFNVKIGLGGTPTVETFGNIRKSREGPVVEEVREPLLDVLDEGDSFRIIAALPGVEAGDIKLDLKDDILTIAAEGKDLPTGQAGRKYSKEVLLSSRAQPGPPTMSYRNGILEVRVRKAPTG
jgi:HSP20 family protein